VYIYIYTHTMTIYGPLLTILVFYIELTHLAQKLKKLTLDETHDTKLNFN